MIVIQANRVKITGDKSIIEIEVCFENPEVDFSDEILDFAVSNPAIFSRQMVLVGDISTYDGSLKICPVDPEVNIWSISGLACEREVLKCLVSQVNVSDEMYLFPSYMGC